MELTAELIAQGVVGLLTVLGAVGVYLRTRQKPPPSEGAVVSGIGVGLIEREQAERLIRVLERIAVSVETMADRRQNDMQETLHDIAEQLKKQPKR
ncbi:MAG: hypothetical protein Rhirs2KO_18650 [Rhizobiaceae bacterium]